MKTLTAAIVSAFLLGAGTAVLAQDAMKNQEMPKDGMKKEGSVEFQVGCPA